MKKLIKTATLILCFAAIITPATISAKGSCDRLYYKGKGRIAVSSDGNMHDNDDMQATMMTLMILAEAGLAPKTVLYTYADHVWGCEDNDLEIMRYAAEETGRRFGFDKTKFMAAVENPEAAYDAMRDAILKSTAKNPLFIIAAGPMHVVGMGLERAAAVNPKALKYVTVISHSEWNDNHADVPMLQKSWHSEPEEPHTGWTWKEMNESFGDKVCFNRISDQNGTGVGEQVYKTKDKFAAPTWDSWKWMLNAPNENVGWIFNQAKTHPCGPDFSDAGMVYYLCADLDGVRGDENGNPEKLRRWMGIEK